MKGLYTITGTKLLRTFAILTWLFCSYSGFSQGTFNSNVAVGNWNVAGSWTLVSGIDGDGIPDANDIVTVLNGNNISLNGSQFANSVTINAGGTLTATGGSLTVVTMAVNGTYVHAIDGGTIPTATRAASSNLNITGVTGTAPGGLNGQTFGNLTRTPRYRIPTSIYRPVSA